MQLIADWLEMLGMSEYAKAFAENRIDFSVLPDLTDQDLEKLGVLLGDRRKMLRAIANLDNTSAAPPRAAASAPSLVPPLPEATSAGERRYLTVMFCDLVDSTGISAQLDAEEWRDLVGSYLDAASAAVTDMGGRVAKKLGDGLMALFGYPLAHENDTESAVRAALAIQRALAELNRRNEGTGKPVLAARIGLETGPAVVDAAGEIYGDVANIAARVQALAEPGAVLVTTRVQRQIAGLFVAEDRGTHSLKGVPDPTDLFRLVRASGGGRRYGQRNLTLLVGRDDEMAMLLRRWERARQGDGQLVMIVGEPGLGKSRLIEEIHARLGEVPHTWVEWSCSQLLQNTPLHPIGEWGRQRFGGADVPAERRLAELESALAQVKLDPAENVSLLAPLLDIPLPQARTPALAPEELRRRQLAALTNWVMASAKIQPIVLAFEDLHWADPTTLDVLRGIAERGALAPLFILATTRPEFRPPWSMRSHHGTISLAPLDRGQVRDMVAELSARHALPTDVVEDVAARTGGVPLFVEEVTRLLLERGEGGGGIEAIPATLQQSLMARLDRLGPAREVAQIGAVIGRGFSYGLLRDVAGMEDAPLQAALEKLAEADIVLVQSLPPESDYRFKHSLIQDAAYENLLKSRRQVLHRRVAEILRDRFADTAAAEPEVLAHHFTQAGMTDAAIEWWGKAGDQALRRSAFQEAISHLGKAIEMADEAVEGAPRAAAGTTSASQRLRLQTGYGQALLWSKGFAADETKAAFTRAQELAAGIDNNSDERFATYYGQWLGSLFRGELALARKTAEIFLREAEKGSWITEALVARRILGLTCLHQGEFREAHAHLVQALRLYDPERDRDAKFRFGQDVGAAATAFLAHIHWEFGEVGQARELIEQALARAAESAHAPTLANTYHHKGVIEILRGDARAVWSATETMVGLGQQHQMGVYLAWGLLHTSWARARLGDCETRVTELRQALGVYTDQGNKLWMPFYQGLLAEIEAEGRGVEEALTRIDEALALAGATGEHWSDAFLHRIRGEILLIRDPADTAPAEEAFLIAIAVAQQQKARSFELRAALSLAKLYQGTNRAAEAYGVLAPALEGFSPTPEFPEIAEAQALLAKLADNEDVKNAATRRQRQVKLHTSYGQAMMWAKGFGSEESKAAFLRVRELIGGLDNPTERASAYYGAWLSSFTRAEIPQAQDTAEAFLKDVSERLGSPEAGLAHRNYGITRWFQGDFVGAREHAEQALTIYDRDRDRELVFKFGLDYGISATAFLALVLWALGEVDDARRISEEAVLQAPQTEHVHTLFFVRQVTAYLEIIRGDSGRATPHLQACFDLALEHGMQLPLLAATYGLAWARWRTGLEKAEAQAAQMRDVRAQIREGHYILFDPLYAKLLADVELGAGRAESALDVVNEAISESEQTGQIWFDSELHRTRGDLLLKCGRPETAGGEAAFKAAIDIARRQQTRAFELRAVLSLAKLYQSSGRAANAHAVLGPALKDFSPTPEFPEIAEAQTLLTALQS